MISLAVGTAVSLVDVPEDELPPENSEHGFVVTDVQVLEDGLEYAVNGVGWYSARNLEFGAPPTEETVEYACAVAADPEDEDADSDSDEDGDAEDEDGEDEDGEG